MISFVANGQLKNLVIQILHQHKEASVNEVVDSISNETGRIYAASTISTILSRLEEEGIISSEKKRKAGRKKKYYQIKPNAHELEASDFLKDYIGKFGDVGIRHLGHIIGSPISKEDLDVLRKKIMG